MKKKIAYIAHPVAGDVVGNIQKVLKIVRDVNLTKPEVVPFAPYITDLLAMDDNIPSERAIGINNNEKILSSGLINELWIYGEKITGGMFEEIEFATRFNIPVILMDPATDVPPELMEMRRGY